MLFSHSSSMLLQLLFVMVWLRYGHSMPMMRAPMPSAGADTDDTTTQTDTEPSPPEFMKGLYECWSLQNATDYKDCLEAMGEGDRVGLIMDTNEVVGLIGNFYHRNNNGQDGGSNTASRNPLKSTSVSFNVSSLISSNNLIKFIELRLFRSRMSEVSITNKLSCDVANTKAAVVNVSLYAETSNGQMRVIESQSISIDKLLQDQWMVFSQLRALIQDWILHPTADNTYRNIFIVTEGHCGERIDPVDIGFHHIPDKVPLLAVFMEVNTSLETKQIIDSTRITPAQTASNMMKIRKKKQVIQNTSCRLVNFTVNFTDLGWSFIIGPSAYQANFCSGSCNYPLSSNQNGTLHSQIQAFYNLRNPNQVPGVCCSPTKTTSLAVLMATDSRTVEIKYFPDMVVTECGCR